MCIIRDGAVFSPHAAECLFEIKTECAQIGREMGIGIALKQWPTPPHMIGESGIRASAKNLLTDGRARTGDILHVYYGGNTCRYNDVRITGLPPSYTADIGDGPFNATRYNDNVLQYSQKAGIDRARMYLRLLGGNTPDSMDLHTPTDFVRYCHPEDSSSIVGHFPEDRATAESGEVEIMGDSRETSIFMEIAEFRILFIRYATYLFQPETAMPSNATDARSSEVRAGRGRGANSKLPGPFVDCGKNLGGTDRKHARVYWFYPTRDVWRGRRERSSLERNARHWPNYRTRPEKKKISFEESGRDCIVFANSSVGFEFAFVEYIQKLHFFFRIRPHSLIW